MEYLAHKDDGREQLLIDHLVATAEKAASFGVAFNAAQEAYLCGYIHDIGKYSADFQKRIRGSSIKVDHSTAGAQVAQKIGDIPAAFCIAGHHAGLPDIGNRTDVVEDGTLRAKLKRKPGQDIPEYQEYSTEIDEKQLNELSTPLPFREGQEVFFFIHMLYSCLVDADYLDTEQFVNQGDSNRCSGDSIKELLAYFEKYVKDTFGGDGIYLNNIRSMIRNAAESRSSLPAGLFSLQVPTGGGKTITSMSFALRHAEHEGYKKIIYVIPYTSIIEQTVGEFTKIFGKKNVLAHYSSCDYGNSEEEETEDSHYLASENWDKPIVVTTSVQFFDSLFSNRSSKCRKLHNIAQSVIIFDEAQMLPTEYLEPCVYAISQLVKHYSCSAVICTATQPSLDDLFIKYCSGYPIRELCPAKLAEDKVFKRVNYIDDGKLSDAKLAEKISQNAQALCIVNSRQHAQQLFRLLGGEGVFHLSTSMYPQHRRDTLDVIRKRLNETTSRCIVVSTSLIEAGVDIDFPVIYREMSGLDSLIQSGGRCNRNGKAKQLGLVHIFESDYRIPESIKQNITAATRAINKIGSVDSANTIKEYFDFIHNILKSTDQKKFMTFIQENPFHFATIADQFHLIDDQGSISIFIGRDKGIELIKKYRRYGLSRGLSRELGLYTVNVPFWMFKKMQNAGSIEIIGANTAVLLDTAAYDDALGLSFAKEECNEPWIG